MQLWYESLACVFHASSANKLPAKESASFLFCFRKLIPLTKVHVRRIARVPSHPFEVMSITSCETSHSQRKIVHEQTSVMYTLQDHRSLAPAKRSSPSRSRGCCPDKRRRLNPLLRLHGRTLSYFNSQLSHPPHISQSFDLYSAPSITLVPSYAFHTTM